MSYTVKNPTDRPIYATLEGGRAFAIEVGESIEVENHRDALNLEPYGALLDRDDKADAVVAEDVRVNVERYGEGVRSGGPQITVKPREVSAVLAVEDVPGLKGKALDEALVANGLAKSGSVDERRARLTEHLTQAPAGGDAPENGSEQVVADNPTDARDEVDAMSPEELTQALVALDVEVDDAADEDARRKALRDALKG